MAEDILNNNENPETENNSTVNETTPPKPITYPYIIINEAYLKKYSPLPNNYNMEEIMPFVHPAEIMWVEPVIGTALYNELLQQVNDNEVTPLNSTLLLNIYPYLAFAVVYSALPFIQYHVSEVGVTKGKSDNSDSITNRDANYMSEHLRKMIEEMKKLLKQFLDTNAEYYPLYRGDGTPCECSCSSDDLMWIYQYYGDVNRYDFERLKLGCMMKKNKPNPYLMLYSTSRSPIDIK